MQVLKKCKHVNMSYHFFTNTLYGYKKTNYFKIVGKVARNFVPTVRSQENFQTFKGSENVNVIYKCSLLHPLPNLGFLFSPKKVKISVP